MCSQVVVFIFPHFKAFYLHLHLGLHWLCWNLFNMPEEDVVFDLPNDIVAKILCRLLVKCLIQFICVSKKWRSIIISDPEFAKSQLQIASEQKTLRHRVLVSTISAVHKDFSQIYPTMTGNAQLQCLDDLSGDTFRMRNGTFPSEQDSNIVMASCNGLVILGSYYEDFSVWNPTTGFFRKIPDPHFTSRTKNVCKDISGRYGFGYVSAIDDYKFVLVIPDDESGAAENVFKDLDVNIFIFPVRANTWSTRKGSRWSFPPRSWGKHCGVLSNEAIHWCVDCSEHDVDGNVIEACYIYAFDLASEELRRVPVPAGLLLDAEESYHMIGRIMQTVFHLGGCLCLLSQSSQLDEERDEIALWIMREYGMSDSWMKVIEFSENDLPDGIASQPLPNSRIGWTSNVSFVTESGAIVVQVSRKLVRIERRIGEKPVCSIPYRFEDCPEDWFMLDTTAYAESLVSVLE